MYNRYIPQSDGSFRRNQVPEQRQSSQQQRPSPQQQSQRYQPAPPPPAPREPEPVHHPVQHRQSSPMAFLKNLLPKDFDTGDLLVVLLLLLMAGDCGEDQNTAILTLALYLFL